MNIHWPAFLTVFLHLLAALLFLIAFFGQDGSSLRWVFFFCAIVFGSIGLSSIRRAFSKKNP